MKINEMNFRKIYHELCYISNVGTFDMFKDVLPHNEKVTGVVAYCYIDHTAGLTFEVLSYAEKTEAGEIIPYDGKLNVMLKCRFGHLSSDCDILVLKDDQLKSKYQDKIDMICQGYEKDPNILKTRNITSIDFSRHTEYPDDVMVVLLRGDNQPEGCWVRCKKVQDGFICGELLNEPNADFNVHMGDMIKFGLMEYENEPVCVAVMQ